VPAVGEGEGFEPGEALGTGLGEGVVLFIANRSSLGVKSSIARVIEVGDILLHVPVKNSRFEVVFVTGRAGINRGINRGQLRREHQGPNFKADQTRP
jgi:hypothetical protein